MKIGMVSESLSHLPFEEMLDAAAKLGIAGVEVNTGNWSSAPHLELDLLLRDSSAREKFLRAFRQRGLELIGLNANGNQLHPTDGERRQPELRARRRERPRRRVRRQDAEGQFRQLQRQKSQAGAQRVRRRYGAGAGAYRDRRKIQQNPRHAKVAAGTRLGRSYRHRRCDPLSKKLGLLEIEWVILGVKVVKGPVDIGFWRLGPTRRSGIMRDGEIGRGTASAVGWIFVRGLSGARDRSWGIW